MTFAALLTKELRLRLRRERTIWVIIIYLLVMGILGFIFIASQNTFNSSNLSQMGSVLYTLLSMVQLFLIMFITPAFTTTTINGEKERQTFDLLLCSRLSSFSLIAGKLIAGLANALLLIAASAPLFSLVFFFGGVTPGQFLSAILVFVDTTVMVGALGLFCSTLLRRPPVSTAITYMLAVLWVLAPWVVYFLLLMANSGRFTSPNDILGLFAWNPIAALISTYPYVLSGSGYNIHGILFAPWIVYTILCFVGAAVLFLLSMWLVKPNPTGRLRRRLRRGKQPGTVAAKPTAA
jgi:ABC-type transport system involved in multi-copper enzyme maturation permease subunit